MSPALTLIERAINFLGLQNLELARQHLQDAAIIDQKARNLHLVFGMYYTILGNVIAARICFNTELNHYPDNQQAINMLESLKDAPLTGDEKVTIKPQSNARLIEGSLATALRSGVSSRDTKYRVLSNIERLEKDIWLEQDLLRYRYAAEHDECWFEQITVLNFLAKLIQPKTYLEVGVRRGRSMSQVAIESPRTQIYGFDMWINNYSDTENPGTEFVLSEIKKLSSSSSVRLHVGNSQRTLPEFFANPSNPQLIDLITIDGDHSYDGAKLDLDLAFQHLAPGGILVFDDIYHHAHLELLVLWNTYKERFTDHLFISDPYHTGTSFVVRPPFANIENALKGISNKTSAPIKILMPYSIKREYGRITLPEWIKESFEMYFADKVKVVAVGPGHEHSIEDSPNFYDEVMAYAEQHQFDLILDVEGGAESLDFMFKRFPKGGNIPKFFWAIDTHQYIDMQIEKAKYFDVTYSAQKDAVSKLGPNAQWLPAGASLHEVDYKRMRTIDVGFVGSITPAHAKRSEIVTRLIKDFPQFYLGQGLFLNEKSEMYSRMKIAINVSLNNDVNFRVFETLATGALLLTDNISNNGFNELFEDGKHLVSYASYDDLRNKIAYYLEHEEERIRIATEGKKLVDEKFRHHILLQKVIRDFESIKVKKGQRAMDITQNKMKTHCWCGGDVRPSLHPLYVDCLECGTQILTKHYTEDELKKFYGAEAYWHDRQIQVFNFPPIEERAVNDFNDRIPVWHNVLSQFKPAPQKLLEIGCAHGGFLSYCRERGAKDVVGVEVDQGTCDFASKRFNLPHVIAGLFPKVQLPYEAFDAITGFDVIEHFLDPLEGLQGVANCLSDDGICFFQTPCYRGEGGDWVQYKPAEHTFLYTEKAITELFERVGLEVMTILPGYFKDDMFVIGKKKQKQKTVVFIRPDAIGDSVLATAMLSPIAMKYGTKVTVVCAHQSREIYQNHPDVARTIVFDRERMLSDDNYIKEMTHTLVGLRADIVLNSVFSRDTICDYLSYATNAKERIAFHGNLSNITKELRDNNNRLYTRVIESDKLNLSELDRHREFLEELDIHTPALTPRIEISVLDKKFAQDFFTLHHLNPEKTIVLGARSPLEIKNYDQWFKALDPILSQDGWFVIALGSEKDFAHVQDLIAKTKWRALNVCGKTSLIESAALISMSRLVASVDTSIAHLACALNVTNVVILGGGHFGRFFPYSNSSSVVCLPVECFGCNWHCRFSRSHCITDVSAELVADVIKNALNTKSRKPRLYFQGRSMWQQANDLAVPRWDSVERYIDKTQVDVIVVESSLNQSEHQINSARATDESGNSLSLDRI